MCVGMSSQNSSRKTMAGEHPEGVFVESTAVSVSAALALSACYTFFKPVLNLQNSHPIAECCPMVEDVEPVCCSEVAASARVRLIACSDPLHLFTRWKNAES